jgi:hypothetical protein
MKFFSILFIGLCMSNGLQGMDWANQDIADTNQQHNSMVKEALKKCSKANAHGDRILGYLIGGVGFVMSMGIPAFFDEKYFAKHSTATKCIYSIAALSLLGYGLDSIFCKVYENKSNDTFEVHGLCTRIKNKLSSF